jgi:hypothetical protein
VMVSAEDIEQLDGSNSDSAEPKGEGENR